MKTTLIGIGEQAGEVLRSCAEIVFAAVYDKAP